MKLFQCQSCGNGVYFENSSCVQCGHRLGYLPSVFAMSAVKPDGDAWRALAEPSSRYVFCANELTGACNWLVPASSATPFCLCCRHNRTVPDLSVNNNQNAWIRVEQAKRHLFYSLTRWGLPMADRIEDPDHGLVFDFLADSPDQHQGNEPVLTGHQDGLITLNIAEADNVERESRRQAMGEPYRTLLGHFRHEIGHFYWDILVRDGGKLDAFRDVFGDERIDYGEALQRHYLSGPQGDWMSTYISQYASSHPWEDFAETWAHYMHMVDGLETTYAFGLTIRPTVALSSAAETVVTFDPYAIAALGALRDAWVPVTLAMNALNRSLGQPDLYPFAMPEPVFDKMSFIHNLIHGTG